jgi:hypothetical protein
MAVRRFDSRRSEMLRIYGTPEQFARLMEENVSRGWHTREEVDEAVKIYALEFVTAENDE